MDPATKAKLERGKRTVEVLKQGLHETLPVENQVVILYALTHGFLDDIPVDYVLRFEEELNRYLASNEEGMKVIEIINQTKNLPDDELMTSCIKSFKAKFA